MGFDGISEDRIKTKKEFNPTRTDLLTIDSLIIDIKARKNALIKRKMDLQNSLGRLKETYKEVDFQSKEFNKTKSTRQNLKECLNKIELDIKGLNEELSYKSKLRQEIEFHLAHNKSLEGKEDLDKITKKINALKTKYSNFAKDRTRIASLRVMASEVLDELENLLKP